MKLCDPRISKEKYKFEQAFSATAPVSNKEVFRFDTQPYTLYCMVKNGSVIVMVVLQRGHVLHGMYFAYYLKVISVFCSVMAGWGAAASRLTETDYDHTLSPACN